MPSMAFLGLPAAYSRGLGSAATEAGWSLTDDPASADAVVAPLRSDADCASADRLSAGPGALLLLVSPFERDALAHAMDHGGFPADWDWDPAEIVIAAAAACENRAAVPAAALRALLPAGPHRSVRPVISDEEGSWLAALAKGTTVTRLADESGYSERAMFRRLADLYARLGAAGRTEALLAAERFGLLADRG